MSTGLVVALILAVGTYALKSFGPVLLASRPLPARLLMFATLLPAALLTALVVVATIGGPRRFEFDARLFGMAAAALALWRKQNFVVVVALAAAATAIARAAGVS